MAIDSINSASNVILFKGNEPKTEENQAKAPEQVKNGKKKLILAAAGLAAVAVAGIAIAAKIKSGKSVKLNDIDFQKGVANLKDGTKYTGQVVATLKSGDKILLEYKDGILQKSTRQGSKSFEKVFEEVNGEKIVKTTVDGKTATTNITQIEKQISDKQGLEAKAKAEAESEAEKVATKITRESSTDDIIKNLPTPEELEKATNGNTSSYINNTYSVYPQKDRYSMYITDDPNYLQEGPRYTDVRRIDYKTSGENAGKYEINKIYYGEAANGKTTNVQRARIIYDPKTGEKTMQTVKIQPSEPKFRKTVDGITTVNGEQKAKRTTEVLEDGTKKITVDYGRNGQRFITISPKGKRTETGTAFKII